MRAAAIALALLLPLAAAAQDKPAPAEPPKPAATDPGFAKDVPPGLQGFGWFAELRGACWKGEHSDGRTSDVQCYLAQYDRLMRGSIKIHRAGSATPTFEGDAVFAIDSLTKEKIIFTQWGSGGVYGTGEVTFEGETLVFRNRLPDGKMSDVRSIWRKTAQGYAVTREREVKDKGWEPLLEVRYTRIP